MDSLRSLAKRVVAPGVYGRVSSALTRLEMVRMLGWRGMRQLTLTAAPGERLRPLKLPGYEHPLYFRPGSPDVSGIAYTFVRDTYGSIRPEVEPRLIIDAGAYIGDTAVFFLKRFQKARIIALEPDPENLKIASRNVAPYVDRIVLIPQGLWSSSTNLEMIGDYSGSTLLKTVTTGAVRTVSCISMNDFAREHEPSVIDIAKLNIEGAEEDVLMNNNAWLDRTRLVAVEFHDAMVERRCLDFLERKGFVLEKHRGFYCARHSVSPFS